jgi:predicted dehydrogenase
MVDRARIGIVGCGDVAYRHYVPGLASRAPDVEIAAVADPRPGAAEALVSAVADWSPV